MGRINQEDLNYNCGLNITFIGEIGKAKGSQL